MPDELKQLTIDTPAVQAAFVIVDKVVRQHGLEIEPAFPYQGLSIIGLKSYRATEAKAGWSGICLLDFRSPEITIESYGMRQTRTQDPGLRILLLQEGKNEPDKIVRQLQGQLLEELSKRFGKTNVSKHGRYQDQIR